MANATQQATKSRVRFQQLAGTSLSAVASETFLGVKG
jgi:hypothetical protein